MTYGDQAYDPYFDREFRERREAPMTTTESPQGQPTEPYNDYDWIPEDDYLDSIDSEFLLDGLEDAVEHKLPRKHAYRMAIERRLARLSAQPSGTGDETAERPDRAVARGDVEQQVIDGIALSDIDHFGVTAEAIAELIELITDGVMILLTTPTETTDAMEDV